ncbi:hypothetical protein CLOP_g4377 [Closterium sp. NIES-67]|nr:hypothetical protein CLOP_g4377 [Closterium sp. NIES-67]
MAVGEATRVALQVFKATGGLVWKRHPMNHTRRANAKTRHERIRQVEQVLRVCAAPASANALNPPPRRHSKAPHHRPAQQCSSNDPQHRQQPLEIKPTVIARTASASSR